MVPYRELEEDRAQNKEYFSSVVGLEMGLLALLARLLHRFRTPSNIPRSISTLLRLVP